MSTLFKMFGLLLFSFALAAEADESFRTLKVKDEVYTNVIVTSSTVTDIYFSHSRGMASAKLKDLDPELQKHFHYDAAKSAETEIARREATATYRAELPKTKRVMTSWHPKSMPAPFAADPCRPSRSKNG
jgi:hypothetical protein